MKLSEATSSSAYAYYPGCSLHGMAREYDHSARLVCQALGIGLNEVEDWVCCGSSSAHSVSHLLSVALPAYNLQLAEKMGLPLAVPCAACFGRLKTAEHELKDEKALAQVNEIIDGDFKNSVEILPLMGVFATEERLSKIQAAVTRPLTGLKVASYYGCLLVRPPKVVDLGEDVENPQMMDRIVQAVGAEPVEWPFKTECCGAFMVLPRPDVLHELSHRILSMAKAAGADCLVTACPMCQSNLDMRQGEIEAKYREKLGLPILYFTQLIGLAMGMSARELEFGKHFVAVEPLLKSKGLV
ncbi:MAG: CoB--CoM heterodisulfide reductase iron-sulfur subunit B family protein [Chloroflexota bacterium]